MRTTAGLEQSIKNGWPIAAMAAINHTVDAVLEIWPDGIIRLWDGIGDLRYGGKDWKGIGPFGTLVGIGGSKRLLVRSVTFQLAGIPSTQEVYLDPTLRNRPAQAWIAGLTADGSRVNGEPYQEVDGLCDYQEQNDDGSGAQTILLHVAEPVYSIERSQSLAWTPEWINDYLSDWRDTHLAGERITGLDKMSELANATKSWTKE
jgi:hypothetical protein